MYLRSILTGPWVRLTRGNLTIIKLTWEAGQKEETQGIQLVTLREKERGRERRKTGFKQRPTGRWWEIDRHARHTETERTGRGWKADRQTEKEGGGRETDTEAQWERERE